MANGDKKDLGRNEYTAMSLYQLLGAPLRALVDAESHAAEATASFIARVGFERSGPGAGVREGATAAPPAGGVTAPAPAAPAAPGGDGWRELGALRMAHLHHTSRDGAVHVIDVPVLSLMPVPALQIKEATVDFAVKVVDTVPLPRDASGPRGVLDPPTMIDLKGSLGRQGAGAAGTRHSETQMHVKITMQQSDVPSGLARLFNLLDQHVTAERLARVEASPSPVVLAPEEQAVVTLTVRDERGELAPGLALSFRVIDAGAVPPLTFEPAQVEAGPGGKATVTVRCARGVARGRLSVACRALRDGKDVELATFPVEIRAP